MYGHCALSQIASNSRVSSVEWVGIRPLLATSLYEVDGVVWVVAELMDSGISRGGVLNFLGGDRGGVLGGLGAWMLRLGIGALGWMVVRLGQIYGGRGVCLRPERISH